MKQANQRAHLTTKILMTHVIIAWVPSGLAFGHLSYIVSAMRYEYVDAKKLYTAYNLMCVLKFIYSFIRLFIVDNTMHLNYEIDYHGISTPCGVGFAKQCSLA